MEILTWLTVIYLVVLVAVLAVGLILILVALRSVGNKLAQISAGLKVVDGNTAPLNADIESLNNTLAGLAGGLQVAEGSFVAANDYMQETLDNVTAVAK